MESVIFSVKNKGRGANTNVKFRIQKILGRKILKKMNEVFEDKLPILISIIRSTYYTKTIGNNG